MTDLQRSDPTPSSIAHKAPRAYLFEDAGAAALHVEAPHLLSLVMLVVPSFEI